jgi:hypothetical protein
MFYLRRRLHCYRLGSSTLFLFLRRTVRLAVARRRWRALTVFSSSPGRPGNRLFVLGVVGSTGSGGIMADSGTGIFVKERTEAWAAAWATDENERKRNGEVKERRHQQQNQLKEKWKGEKALAKK